MICPHCKKETVKHGSTRYTKGCRCDICKEARVNEIRRWRAKKSKEKKPNPNGSWGVGIYSTKGDGQADGYGFYRPENPNNFWPDYESCTEWEIANHKAACEAFKPARAKDE